jgi:hypothetical protein
MKEVATLTVRQNPVEPRLKMRIYRDKREHFYGCIESDDPAIPPLMPVRIKSTNFKDAKARAEKWLHIIRGIFRVASGKAPDLPVHMKEMEKEIPAYLHHLLTNSFVGEN